MAPLPPSAATVLMSGGVDSTACAHFLKARGAAVCGLFVNHGQAAASCETRALEALAPRLQIKIETARLTGAGNLGIGELVGRNAMLIFSAVFLTRAAPGLLAIGAHAGSTYFDCSSAFMESAGRLVSEITDGRVSLVAPFIEWTKQDIYDYFINANLPLELTYSCEAGSDPACGTCASCKDRLALA